MDFDVNLNGSLLTRREFVLGGAAVLGGSLIPGRAWTQTDKGCLLSPSMQSSADGKGTLFSVLNLNSGALAEFPVPLGLGHSWINQPGSNRFGCVPESGGRKFCILDLKEKRAVNQGETLSKSLILGGHADYSPDGQTLYITQSDLDAGGTGSISVRDAKTLREIGRLPTHGQFPHEVYVREGGKELLTANLGADPGNPAADAIRFCRIETASGKVLENFFVKPDAARMKNVAKEIPEGMWGETAYYLEMGNRIITFDRNWGFVLHPHGQAISIWNLKGALSLNKLLNFAPLQPVAFAFTNDWSRLAITLSDNSLVFLHKRTWTPDAQFSSAKRLRTSTHLYSGPVPS